MAEFRELRGRRVLVTGGLGFVGSNVAAACMRSGATVTILDSLDERSGGNRANVSDLHAVEMIEGDIRDQRNLREAVSGRDMVIHCAALTSHTASMQEPAAYFDTNCLGTLALLDAMRRHAADARLVHVGTSTQVGPMRYSPIDEVHPEFPVDAYSASKSAAEKLVLILAHAHGLRATVVRLANLYGPRAHVQTSLFGFTNFFIGLALRNRPLPVYGSGAQLRTVTYVEDAVHALLLAATRDAAIGEVFFAVAETQVSVSDIAEGIASTIGGHVQHVPWPDASKAIEIGDAIISSRKIRETLGWSAAVNFRQGLVATRDYFMPRLGAYLAASRPGARMSGATERSGNVIQP